MIRNMLWYKTMFNKYGADLYGTNLRWADLRGANVDASCFPLWCGSFDIKCDDRLPIQLLYHIFRLDSPVSKALRKIPELVKMANEFHRINGDVQAIKEVH